MSKPIELVRLTKEGCESRQARLVRAIQAAGLDAAVLTDPPQVHALTGYWARVIHQPVLLVRADGASHLAVPREGGPDLFAGAVHRVVISRKATMIDDPLEAAMAALSPNLQGLKRIGSDGGLAPGMLADRQLQDICPMLRTLKRTKLPDEVEMIRAGIRGVEAAYALAAKIIRPGLDEMHMYAQLLAAATEAVGEPIGEFGNDFQSGTGGGPPRHRAMIEGELMPLDLSVIVRGHWSDLCRTFCVGGRPSSAQRDAHQRVVEALQFVESSAKPGTRCQKLYADVSAMLDGFHGLHFGHHLGHGIGLCAHESPRLNPEWDDVLQEGDVITAEPGLYGDELRGGVRLEQNYLMTADGLTRLSAFPLAMNE